MDTTPLTADELIKHWLLNLSILIEAPVWLDLIFPQVEGEALNAKEIRGCKPEDYARGMIELFDSGMISMSSEWPADNVECRDGIQRILDRFLNLKERTVRPGLPRPRRPAERCVTYELTPRGGEAWEALAEADWTHILIERSDLTCGELVSPNRDLLMAHIGWYPEINGKRIQLETIMIETHSNFRILYWKRLLFVYRASFSFERAEARRSDRLAGSPKWFREWWESSISWYKKPWQLSGWPPG